MSTIVGISPFVSAWGTSITLDISAISLQQYDVIIFHQVSAIAFVSPPSGQGWVSTGTFFSFNPSGGSASDLTAYAKVWGSGSTDDSTPTFSQSSGTSCGICGILTVIRGLSIANLPNVAVDDCQITANTSPSSGLITAPDATASSGLCTVVRLFGSSDLNSINTPSTGTLIYGGTATEATVVRPGPPRPTNFNMAMAASYLSGVPIGSVGTSTMTETANGPDPWGVATLVLPELSTITLTGNGNTSAIGSLNVALSKMASGNGVTGSTGIIAHTNVVGIIGNSATAGVGLVAGNAPTVLTGNASTGSIGTISHNLTVAITGNSATGAVGVVVSPGVSRILGVGALSAVGLVTSAISKAVTGDSSTGSVGTVVRGFTAIITGNRGTTHAGTILVQKDGAATLTGVSATSLVGNIVFKKDFFITNRIPSPDEQNFSLTRPVYFSLRGANNPIDISEVNISVGYSSIHGEGSNYFDQIIPGTVRKGLLAPLSHEEPIISLQSDNFVQIIKATDSQERSTYFTALQVGDVNLYDCVMVSAIINPISVSNDPLLSGAVGPVFGLELGPRNTGVYVFLKNISGVNSILLTGPIIPDVAQAILATTTYDWSGTHRYTISWNESRGIVQLFIENLLLLSVNIADIPLFSTNTLKRTTGTEYLAVYGLEGPSGDSVNIGAISITTNVGYPVFGIVRSSTFNTITRPVDLVKTSSGIDPRKDPVSPWVNDGGLHFNPVDQLGSIITTSQFSQFAKVTENNLVSLAVYREEPGFLLSNIEAFCIDLTFFSTSTSRDGDAAGMGFVIDDGYTAFRVSLFQSGSVRYIGVLSAGGDETLLSNSVTAIYDWTVPNTIRFVVDSSRQFIKIYDLTDPANPILDAPFLRVNFPTSADFSWTNLTPFIAFGHFTNTHTTGSMYVEKLAYSTYYRYWYATDGLSPDDSANKNAWSKTVIGSPVLPVSPISKEFINITCGYADGLTYNRPAVTNAFSGASIEARLAITGNDEFEHTGDALILDDGLHSFVLAFTETEEGKFACMGLRSGLSTYQESAGFNSDSGVLSFAIDWTQPHTYRLERKPNEGTFVFVDNSATPSLTFPESRIAELPDTIYLTPTVAFGHFLQNAPSNANWYFVNTNFSIGFDVAFKKNEPDSVLKTELFGAELIVLVEG